MDAKTAAYYSENAAFCVQQFEAAPVASAVAKRFASALNAGSVVLDVGCGSGRDVAILAELGHDVWGVEPAAELAVEAVRVHPELEGRITSGYLPNSIELPASFPRSFDAVVCSAVLMHVSKKQLPEALSTVRSLLKPGGRLLISIPNGRPGIVEERDAAGRLFSGVIASELQVLAEGVGLRPISLWANEADAKQRAEHSWDVLLFEC